MRKSIVFLTVIPLRRHLSGVIELFPTIAPCSVPAWSRIMPTSDNQRPQRSDIPEDDGQTIADDSSLPVDDGQTVHDTAADLDTADRHSAVTASQDSDNDRTLMDPSLVSDERAADSTAEQHGDQTIVEDADSHAQASAVDSDQFDATLMDASLAQRRMPVPAADRISNSHQPFIPQSDDDAQTFADADLKLREPAESDSSIFDRTLPDQTFADPSDSESQPAGTDFDQTIADHSQADAAEPDATIADASALHETNATVDDASSLDQDNATQFDAGLAAGSDRTMIEGDSTADTDATRHDSPTGQSEFDRTMVEDEFTSGGTSVEGPSSGGDVDVTIVSRDDQFASAASSAARPRRSAPPPKQRRPAAHETADRWEAQQRYQLVSNFARGGLGQIWLAQDSRLRREVAYKELLPSALKNKNALERFLEEAQITGQLEHPGIVPIYDIGYQQNGTPFYAMKLVRGETMEKHIDALHQLPKDSPEFSLTFRKLLRNFIDICNALAFAHDRGVLHRDLKPLNVMLGAFGETLVLDWGLAKVLDVEVGDNDAAPITTETDGGFSVDEQTVIQSSDGSSESGDTQGTTAASGISRAGATQGATTSGASMGGRTQQMSGTFGTTRRMIVTDVRSVGSQTMMGSVMGTPAYMPPEQGRGDLEQLDARSDIYSLGGILYKLLTNQQPIAKGKIREVLKNVTEGNIIPPREHDPGVPKPLEAVCLKALSKNKEDRYASALDLARDVEAWLADEPVSCFEDPWLVKAWRWAKRHPTAVGSGVAAVTVALLAYGTVRWNHSARMNDIRDFARANLSQAETAATQSDFAQSKQLLTAAIGRVSGEGDLVDLLGSLESRLSLLESDRVRKLERDVETDLARARTQIRNGEYEAARTLLAELQTRLKDETLLPELTAAVEREVAAADQAIAREAAVAQTEARFEQFLELCDAARARGSLQTMDNVDDDARLAQKHATAALELFDLNTGQPFADTPDYFDESLPWTRRYNERTGRWPLAELKSSTLELLLILGDMEIQLARNLDAEQQKAAAERALTFIQPAKSIGIESVALYGDESLWLKLAGREDESRQVLAQAKKLKATTSLDFYLLAEAERKSNNFRKALELYQQAQQLSPTSYWPQHFTGLCHMQLGEAEAALACFTNCTSLRETYAWPWMLRGVCNAQLKRVDAALADFDTAEKLAPDLYNIPVNRGVVLTVAGRFDEAIAQFERAAKLAPTAAAPHINIATTHFQIAQRIADSLPPFDNLSDLERLQQEQDHYSQSLDALAVAAATERAPDHPGIYQLRGRIEERSGNTQAALASYQRHLQVEPNTDARALTLHRIGSIHFQLAEYDAALTDFEKAHQLKPSDAHIVRDLAETHLQLRQAEQAQQRFDEYLKLVNADIEEHLGHPDIVFNGMATAENLQRKKAKAADYYTLSLMFNPEQAGVLSQRGWLFLTDGLQLAKADFEAAVARNGNDPHTLTGLALTQTRLGDWQSALKTMEPALPAATEQAQEVGPPAFALFHNAATVYAQCIALIQRDPRLNDEQRKTSVTALYHQVELLLRKAKQIAAPSPPVLRAMQQAVKVEPEFAPLRSMPEFQALQSELLGESQ
ncbi:protein kinase [bacterium]|nr:protein kinase [bacterium]